MNQLTIRGFPPELEKVLRATAEIRGISMNKAALLLMRRGAGLRTQDEGVPVIGHSLDAYFGAMSPEDAEQVDRAVAELDRETDREFWK